MPELTGRWPIGRGWKCKPGRPSYKPDRTIDPARPAPPTPSGKFPLLGLPTPELIRKQVMAHDWARGTERMRRLLVFCGILGFIALLAWLGVFLAGRGVVVDFGGKGFSEPTFERATQEVLTHGEAVRSTR